MIESESDLHFVRSVGRTTFPLAVENRIIVGLGNGGKRKTMTRFEFIQLFTFVSHRQSPSYASLSAPPSSLCRSRQLSAASRAEPHFKCRTCSASSTFSWAEHRTSSLSTNEKRNQWKLVQRSFRRGEASRSKCRKVNLRR